MKTYVLIQMHDWEITVYVYTSETAMWEQIRADAYEAAEAAGETLPNDPEDWPAFIQENGWKCQAYEYESRTVSVIPDVPYDKTPAARVLCGKCGTPIRHEDGDPADSWIADDNGYACGDGMDPATEDHKPATVNA
jgi:hypothetical protein